MNSWEECEGEGEAEATIGKDTSTTRTQLMQCNYV